MRWGRWAAYGCGGAAVALAALIAWQPDSLKGALLRALLDRATRGAGYALHFEAVRGNVFRRISVDGLSLSLAEGGLELARVSRLELQADWNALLEKKVRIKECRLLRPTLRWILASDGRAMLPVPAPRPRPKGPGRTVEIARLAVRDGRLECANFSLHPPSRLTADRITLSAAWTGAALHLERFGLRVAGGSAEARGSLLPAAKALRLTLKTRELPLQEMARFLLGREDLTLSHTGDWRAERKGNDWNLNAEGRLNSAPLALQAQIKAGEGTYRGSVRLQGLRVRSVTAVPGLSAEDLISCSLALSGSLARPRAVDAKGEAAWTSPQAEGKPRSLRADLDLKRGAGSLRLEARAPGARAQARGRVDILKETAELRFSASVQDVKALGAFAPELRSARGRVKLEGTVSGAWRAPALRARALVEKAQWRDVSLRSLEVRGEKGAGKEGIVRLHGQAAGLSAGRFGSGPWGLESARWRAEGRGPSWKVALDAGFKNQAALHWEGRAVQEGKAWSLAWESGRVSVDLPGQGRWTGAEPGRLRAESGDFQIENLALRRGSQSLAVNGGFGKGGFRALTVNADALDLALIQHFAPALAVGENARGSARLRLDGKGDGLSVQGEISAALPHLEIKPSRLRLEDVRLRLASAGPWVEVREFSARTRKGTLDLRGKSRLPKLDFRVIATRLSLSSGLAWQADSDLNVSVRGTVTYPLITGRIKVHSGTYRRIAAKKKKGEAESGRGAGAGEKPARAGPSLWARSAIDLQVVWPRDVWYRDDETGVETRGSFYLRKAHGASRLFPEGELAVVRGNYVYMGRNFKLESGAITFTGPPVIDPILDVRAIYRSDPTEIVLNVGGTAKAPQLELSSNPPMSEQDILSLLVFGVPAGDLRAGKAEGGPAQSREQRVRQAAGQMLGSYLSKKAREKGLEKLNLDVLAIQPVEKGARVTVGRYIGDRIFITYGQGLGRSAGRKFSAEYYITPIWTLQGEAGTDQKSLDLQFRIPMNRPGPVRRRGREGNLIRF